MNELMLFVINRNPSVWNSFAIIISSLSYKTTQIKRKRNKTFRLTIKLAWPNDCLRFIQTIYFKEIQILNSDMILQWKNSLKYSETLITSFKFMRVKFLVNYTTIV